MCTCSHPCIKCKVEEKACAWLLQTENVLLCVAAALEICFLEGFCDHALS